MRNMELAAAWLIATLLSRHGVQRQVVYTI